MKTEKTAFKAIPYKVIKATPHDFCAVLPLSFMNIN